MRSLTSPGSETGILQATIIDFFGRVAWFLLHRVFITTLQFISVVYRCGQWFLNRLLNVQTCLICLFWLSDIKCELVIMSFFLVSGGRWVCTKGSSSMRVVGHWNEAEGVVGCSSIERHSEFNRTEPWASSGL